jgi:PAS domain S-box-containing protein
VSQSLTPQASPRYSWLPLLIIVMTIATLAIGVIALHYLETRLIAAKGETLALAAADIADKLDLLLYERYADIYILANAPVFQGADAAPKTTFLKSFQSVFPVYRWLGVTDAHGRMIASTEPKMIGEDRSDREWFQAVRARGGIHVRDAEASEDTGGVWAVAFTAPIVDSRGTFLGAVSTRVGLPAIEDIFARTIRGFHLQQGSSDPIEYQFLTRDGDLIVDSILGQEGKLNLVRMALPSALFAGSAHPGYVEEEHLRRHVRVVTGYAQTEGYGNFTGLHWGILVRIDRSTIVAPIRTVLGKLGLAGLVIVLPLLGFLLWTTGRLRAEFRQAQEECARATTAEGALLLRDRAIAASGNGIFITDPNQPGSPIIYANSAFERLTGYAAKDIVGYTYRFLQGPDTDPAAFDEIRQAMRENRECRVVMKHYVNDGSVRWNDVMIAPIHSDASQVTHFVGVLTDITDRKQAEEALRESEARLVQFLHGLPVAVFVMDATGRPCYANHAAERLLGKGILHEKTAQLAETYNAYLAGTEQNYPLQRMPIMRALAGESSTVDDMEIREGGRTIALEVTARPIFNAAGDIIYAVAAFTDITDRKRANRRLAKINECFLSFGTDPTDNISRLTKLCGELLEATCAVYNRVEDGMLYAAAAWQMPSEYQAIGRSRGHLCHDVIRNAGDHLLVVRNLPQSIYAETDPNILQCNLRTYLGKAVKCHGEAIGSLCVVYTADVTPDDADKKLMSIIVSAIGVEEERRKAEEAMEGLRLQNEMILNSAGEGIYGIDQDGNTTFVNPAAAKMLGWEAEELLGQPMHDIVHHSRPDAPTHPVTACPIMATTGDGLGYRVAHEVFWRKDGTSFPVEYTSNPIREGASIQGAVITFKDITERKKAEEKLKLYREIFALSHDGIAIIGPDGIYLEQNDAHRKLLGYSDAELRGQTPAAQVGEDAFAQIARQLAATGKVRGEFVARTNAGEAVHIDLSAFSMLNEVGDVVCHIGIKRDITERKRAEAIRSRLLEQVISAQEDERGRIARELHDETGQSLTALLVGLRTLESAQSLEDAKLWAESLRTIVSLTLHEVGRLAWGLRPSVLDDLGLIATLERYATEYADSYAMTVDLKTTGFGTARLPFSIETTLYRIMQEVLTNVAKHAAARQVTITVDQEPTCVQMIIKDDGQGFNVQETMRTPGSCKGIGLHSMQERATLLNGTLKVDSTPGHGTTIIVRIPLPKDTHP